MSFVNLAVIIIMRYVRRILITLVKSLAGKTMELRKIVLNIFVCTAALSAVGQIVSVVENPDLSAIKIDSPEFIKGADVSFLPQIEDLGGVYRDEGVPQEPLKIFRDHGFNYIRLKLWHSPAENYNNRNKILYMARRIRDRNLKFLLNFHFSDTWADPGKQYKPAAWIGLPFETLKDSVCQYTKSVLRALYDQQTLPEMVQLGNEINQGILWNEGRVGGSYDTSLQWSNLAELLKQAIRGVRESCAAGESVRIMIHIANAADRDVCRWFFDHLTSQGVPFDVIGLSFYPWWHGTLNEVRANLNELAVRYGKDLVIAETAYPWTLQWYDDNRNIVGSRDDLHAGYPATGDGQMKFLRDLMQIIRAVGNQKGIGLFYWAPEYISVQPIGSPWENNTLFDFYGDVLPSMDVFLEEPFKTTPIEATIRLNTSTLMDTLQEYHFTQIRGEVSGVAMDTLPDSKRVTWDSDSELVLKNVGGDYWETTVQMYPEDVLSYKFWAGFDINTGTFQRIGWEGPIIPAGEFSDNRRVFVAGENDTVIAVQYFNSTSESKTQYWKPFVSKPDSIALYFRVNMTKAMESGRFDPGANGPVAVRGDASKSGASLDWNVSKVLLQREEFSVNGGSFWSGVCYIAKKSANAGDILEYKFYIENDSRNGWENDVDNRRFIFTRSLIEDKNDTTIHWAYFDFDPDVSADSKNPVPVSARLYQNYPNPFNPSTRIKFSLDSREWVKISVLNILGEEIQTLIDEVRDKGIHEVRWDGRDSRGIQQGSGLYFIELKSESFREIIKTVMIR